MSTITIHVRSNGHTVPVMMPATTTARYAAKRAAEALGLDPDAREWGLSFLLGRRIPQDAVMADWDGFRVHLTEVGK